MCKYCIEYHIYFSICCFFSKFKNMHKNHVSFLFIPFSYLNERNPGESLSCAVFTIQLHQQYFTSTASCLKLLLFLFTMNV